MKGHPALYAPKFSEQTSRAGYFMGWFFDMCMAIYESVKLTKDWVRV